MGKGGRGLQGLPDAAHVGALRQRAKRLQDITGVRPGGTLLVVHVGDHREADEQRGLLRVVVGRLDPHREPLDDLHEVARGVLRRQQGNRSRAEGDRRTDAHQKKGRTRCSSDRRWGLADSAAGELTTGTSLRAGGSPFEEV